jgi:hypothetical protein
MAPVARLTGRALLLFSRLPLGPDFGFSFGQQKNL